MKIGIGITTRNRKEVFTVGLAYQNKYLPENAELVIYEDCSDVPYTDNCGTERIGVAKAKNQCLRYLYDHGCTHIFLFDDDTFPIKKDWHLPFIESGVGHLNYTPIDKVGTLVINQNGNIIQTDCIWGCMLYFNTELIGKPLYNELFGIYGMEHCELTHRIHKEGNKYKYATLANISELLYSYDYDLNWLGKRPPLYDIETQFTSSVHGEDVGKYVEQNKTIYVELTK